MSDYLSDDEFLKPKPTQPAAPATPPAKQFLTDEEFLKPKLSFDVSRETGTIVPKQEQPGFVDRLKGNYMADVDQGVHGMTEGTGKLFGRDASPWERVKGAGQAALGAAEYATSPINAASKTIVGDPVTGAATKVFGEKAGKIIGDTANLGSQVLTGAELPKLAKAGVEAGGTAMKALERSRAAATAREIRDAISPTSAGPKAKEYAGAAREIIGTEERDAAKAIAAQKQFQPVVDAMDETQLRELNGYIQGRSSGAAKPTDTAAAALADSLRGVFQQYRTKLEALPQTEGMGFQEDYLNQLWKKGPDGKPLRSGAVAEDAPLSGGKQGSTGFTKAKTYDTLEDGIAAGLQPVTLDPIKLTAIYVNNAKKYIGAARMLNAAEDMGEFGFYKAGEAPEGWQPLNGRWTDKPARTIVETAPDAAATHLPSKQAYAPAEIARIYNNHIAKGMSGNNIYEMARATSRASVAMTLGVDVYHATAETMHAISQTVSDAFRAAAMGEGKQALKTLGKTKDIVPEMFNHGPGRKARDVYLHDALAGDTLSPGDKRVVDLLTRANFGFNRGEQYSTYVRPELEKSFSKIWQDRPPGLTGTAATLWETTKKGMATANKPLFEHYIPNLRAAAAKRELGNYIERHPEASDQELVGVARDISDAIDNRFGLMVHDNRFWNKYVSQVSQLAMLAPEWTIGKIDMAAKGIKGLPDWITALAKGEKKEMPVATAQLLGLAATTAFANLMFTYLHTGNIERPMDAVAYRSGGTTPRGDEERGTLPGEQKDYLGYLNDPVTEFINKLNPVLKAGTEAITNKNWRGDPVADPGKNIIEQLPARAAHVGGAFTPGAITLQNVMTKDPDSKISTPERVAGARPAPQRFTAPERNQAIEDYVAKKRMAAKQRHEQPKPGSFMERMRGLLQ